MLLAMRGLVVLLTALILTGCVGTNRVDYHGEGAWTDSFYAEECPNPVVTITYQGERGVLSISVTPLLDVDRMSNEELSAYYQEHPLYEREVTPWGTEQTLEVSYPEAMGVAVTLSTNEDWKGKTKATAACN